MEITDQRTPEEAHLMAALGYTLANVLLPGRPEDSFILRALQRLYLGAETIHLMLYCMEQLIGGLRCLCAVV
jgi:hypothetical protein